MLFRSEIRAAMAPFGHVQGAEAGGPGAGAEAPDGRPGLGRGIVVGLVVVALVAASAAGAVWMRRAKNRTGSQPQALKATGEPASPPGLRRPTTPVVQKDAGDSTGER